tara:strand:+ start:732 stop:2165 length:1434 start_codon:yes stop_codon:yes gene_type:complete
MERVLPKTIDYTDVLPLAVESKSRRRTFFPTNGQTFQDDTNNIVRIDISADALLDTQHSYLRFTGTFNAATAGIDFAGGHSFIRRLRVEQSGTILEDIQNYNKLMGGIVLPCQCGADYLAERSITEGVKGRGSCESGTVANFAGAAAVNLTGVGADADDALGVRSMNSIATNNNNILSQVAAAGTYDFCIPLTSGIFNNEKLIPLMLMSAPLTIEIELAPHVQAVAASGAGTYTWSNVRYIANLVEVGQDVAQQLRMVQEMSGGVLTLAGQTYRHFSGQITGGAESVINIPARVKSMKSIFFFSKGSGNNANASYDLGSGGTMALQEYQLKIGSVVYPPTPVQCSHRGGAAIGATGGQRSEQLMELAKAWGNVGSTKGLGMLTSLNYGATIETESGGAAAGGLLDAGSPYVFCPYGLDLEAFQRVAIESGVNTADRSLPISLILSHTSGQAAQTLDAYVLADALFYINSDGSMSVSV